MKITVLITMLAVMCFSCGHMHENSSITTSVASLDQTDDDIKKRKKIGTKILVLYKERDPDHEGLVYYLTSLLEKAGFEWEKMEIEKLLREKETPDLSRFGGIMTCYQTSQMIGGDEYPKWLVKQMEEGRKILIVGSYGAYQNLIPKPYGSFIEYNESTRTINTFFWPFGLEFLFGFTNDPAKLVLTKSVKEYSQYEASLDPQDLTYFQLFRSVNPHNKVYLEINRADMLNAESAFVVHTPFGGMILEGYGYYWSEKEKRVVQRVNMVKFIKEALTGKTPSVPRYSLKTHVELLKEHPLPKRAPPKASWPAIKGEIKRRVLVLYKRSEAATLEEHLIYNRAAVVLEYLGVVLDYHAVEDGLPSNKEMEKYRGIITWNGTAYMPEADRYSSWLAKQVRKGRRLVILGKYGASVDSGSMTIAKKFAEPFKALGIEYARYDTSLFPLVPTLRVNDEKMLGFERTLSDEARHFTERVTSINPLNRVHVGLSDPHVGDIDLVVTGPHGGIALEDSFYWFPRGDLGRVKLIHQALRGEVQPEIAEEKTLGAWIINPYLFFTESLGLEEVSAPDITTLNGSRIFYSHIDGDGLDSISLIDRANSAGDYIYKEIFNKYKEIPFSVSVISGLLEKAGNEYYHPSAHLARKIFRLPNCEVASHTTNHPFDWIGGDPYIVNPDSYPYEVAYNPQDNGLEIWASKLFIEKNLAPPDKKCELLLWSGATNPDHRALAIAWRAGMYNLNGGDPRYDKTHNSLTGLCPYSYPYSPYRQYLTSGANDYIYMLFMTGDWAGQKDLIEHFDRTENPYRVFPMNLYFHFYSGIKQESIGALSYVLDHVRNIDTAQMFTTDYLKIIEDFYNTRSWRDAAGAWIFRNNGDLRTIRFRNVVEVDMAASKGVLGYNHYQDQTYVHLDGSKERRIVLGKSDFPYLRQSTFFVDALKTSNNGVTMTARGMGNGLFKIAGLTPNTDYQIRIKGSSLNINDIIKTDAKGVLTDRRFFEPPVSIYEINISDYTHGN